MITKELKKIEALCNYANKLVTEAGLKDQYERSKLYDIDNYKYFKTVLYVHKLFPDFRENEGVSFSVRRSLYKRITGLGKEPHYITLLDALDDERFHSDFYYYSKKIDIDECDSLSELKRKARAMIKNPSNYFRSE